MEDFDEISALENFIEKLDEKLDRKNRTEIAENGAILFTPFFGKFSRCECRRSRSDERFIGIRSLGDLKSRFLGVEMRLKDFAAENGFSHDFKLAKNGFVWAKAPTQVPKNFVGDVTLRFDSIFFGDTIHLGIDVVGITRFEKENGRRKQVGFFDAEMALKYLKEHNEV